MYAVWSRRWPAQGLLGVVGVVLADVVRVDRRRGVGAVLLRLAGAQPAEVGNLTVQPVLPLRGCVDISLVRHRRDVLDVPAVLRLRQGVDVHALTWIVFVAHVHTPITGI